jgi:hypothetical protein
MAVLSEIRKRPWILIGFLAIALLAFLVDSLDKVFGKDPNILGKVNGEKSPVKNWMIRFFFYNNSLRDSLERL